MTNHHQEPLNELALFAGAGGGILGGKLLGWRTVCAVEIDSYCRKVLLARQADGFLDRFPIWDDVKTFDGRPWRGHIDVISGGFPCQDISEAGKRRGIEGEQSGLWQEMARIIGEVRPRYALIENSPMLPIRGLDRILCDLASMGYDARWAVLGCGCLGAPHDRERAWVLAMHPDRNHDSPKREIPDTRWMRANAQPARIRWWDAEPGMGRMANGMADRSKRNHAIGNGQVPAVVRLAWNTLSTD